MDNSSPPSAGGPEGWVRPALPYVVPFAVMLALTALADALPALRLPLYVAKVPGVCLLLWVYRRHYAALLRPAAPGQTMVAVLAGLAIIVFWIAADPYYPQTSAEWQQLLREGWQVLPHTEKMAGAFDPYAPGSFLPPVVIIVFRVLGAVVMTPLAEELFHRGWLLRFLVKDDIRQVSVGTFTWPSFAISVVLFGFSHHEWLAGVVCGVALNGLLYWRRSLWLCVVAHAVANLALAGWVLSQEAWGLW